MILTFFTRGHSWPFVVTRGHSWPFVVTRGHSWSLVVTRGHSWSLVVTRGHSCVLLDMIKADCHCVKRNCGKNSRLFFSEYFDGIF